MNISIKEIKNRGDLENERVVYIVNSDCDLGRFLSFKTKSTDDGNSISNLIINPYWFPDTNVKKGDLVVLYTKSGVNNSRENEDKTTTHFFYLDNNDPIFKEETDMALLIYAEKWTVK